MLWFLQQMARKEIIETSELETDQNKLKQIVLRKMCHTADI
jgi:hypothetical protein